MIAVALRAARFAAAVLLCLTAGQWRAAAPALAQANLLGTTITVSATSDDITNNQNCTLREAVQAANLDQPVDACPAGSGKDTIHVPAGTYTLSIPGTFENNNQTGDIDIRSSLIIQGDGQGQTILQVNKANVVDRIFQVVPSDVLVTVSGVTLRNGNLTTESTPGGGVEEPKGGAIYNAGVLKVNNSALIANVADGGGSGRGGALYNNGSLEVTGSFFAENDAGYTAGAIHNDHVLTVTSTRFERNRGYGTGGIYTAPASQTTISDSQFVANQIGLGAGAALTLTGPAEVQNSLFDNNQGEGGTIANYSHLTIRDSQFTNNHGGDAVITVSGTGSSLALDGVTVNHNEGIRSGGIYSAGSGGVTIQNSAITNNTSSMNGGAITLAGGNLEMHSATLHGNHAQQGGGVYIGADAQVFATQSTISQNTASGQGGGVYSQGQFNIQISTISGNQAAQGGGIYLSNGQESILYDTTLTANSPGGAEVSGGRLGFVRAILAGNLPAGSPDCVTQAANAVYSRGHNLVGNATGCNWTPDIGDIIGSAQNPVNPLLGPLSDNGGPTFTHALLAGSPALDAAGTQNCGPTDQRGLPRPSGPACDIGAYESQPAASIQYFLYLPSIQR